MCTKYYDQMMYGCWDWCMTDVITFHLGHFLPFHPHSPKNQNLKNNKKSTRRYHHFTFYICAPKIMITWCMILGIWCVTDVIVISHFRLFFALYPLPPSPRLPCNSPRNQSFEKIKKRPGDSIILRMCTKNYDHMMTWCMVPEIWCVTDVIVTSHFGLFFALLPLTGQKTKISKNWKKHLEISSFYISVPKLWSDGVWFLWYGVWQMDGRMDKRTEKVTYRGGCPT